VEFVQARWFHQGRKAKVRLLVVHSMESGETDRVAEGCAAYFARGERKASAHFCIDNNSTVQCVRTGDTAFGAAGANHDGIHFELAGRAGQTASEWDDRYSRALIANAGEIIRATARSYSVPLRWLTVAQVADGTTAGLCTHADVSKAFPAVSTGHWDPGPHFPKAEALALWIGTPPAPEPEDESDMTFIIVPASGGGGFALLHAGKIVGIATLSGIDQDRNVWDLRNDSETWARVLKAYGPVVK
jgi:N-acetyl-anhydromuramyl-L-alanine amidase AmpD